MGNGSSTRHEGGVLITAVVTVVIMSLLLIFLVENYQLQVRFTKSTREYYEIQLIRELFLTDYLAQEKEEQADSGQVTYNKGRVEYKKTDEKLSVTIYVEKQKRQFSEVIPTSKK